MNKLLYFAFGSNMLLQRLVDRVGPIIKVQNYKLQGYRLVFNSGIYKNNSFANIEPDINCSVEGVLYDLNERQIGKLDFFEGYPNNYEKFYKIENIDDIPVIIFGYRTVSSFYKTINGKPDLKYLNIVMSGAAQNGLEDTYNKLIIYKLANYKLKGAPKDMRSGKFVSKSKFRKPFYGANDEIVF